MATRNRQINIVLCFFMLFSFLHPRGLDEISSVYKTFLTGCMYLSLLLIFIIACTTLFTHKFNLKNCWFFVFFALNIVLTLASESGLSRGLQILFASPALFYFVLYEMRYAPNDFIKCLSIILIVFLFLNIPLTELIFKNIYHIMFIGHVQTASQVGLLAIFISALNFHIGKLKTGIILLFLTVINMLYSQTDSSLCVLIICLIAYFLYKFKLRKVLNLNSIFYFVLLISASIIIIYMTVHPGFSHFDLSFNGRNFVWASAMDLVNKNLWFGYGVENAYIEVPWGDAMTYAHNQLVQLLLDGGILLAVAFCLMIMQCCFGINKMKSNKIRFLCNTVLISLLFIMIFDSTTLYCYMYVMLGLIVAFTGTDKIKTAHKQCVGYSHVGICKVN